jgi:hypothetical protein
VQAEHVFARSHRYSSSSVMMTSRTWPDHRRTSLENQGVGPIKDVRT